MMLIFYSYATAHIQVNINRLIAIATVNIHVNYYQVLHVNYNEIS